MYKEVGESVNAQQPLALLGDMNNFVLRLVVDASDINRIKLGQRVQYTIDAYPDSIFYATVAKIFPVLDNESQSFRIDAQCDGVPIVPFVGTQVQANIIIAHRDNALVIPRSYITNSSEVSVKDGSNVRVVKVISGISNLEFVEIVSGIDEKSTLAKTK